MTHKSHIEKLIHNLCPNGVEYKELGELCIILDSKRKPVAKGLRSKGIYPYYGANGILDYVGDYIFDGTYLLLGEDGSVINEDKSPVLHWAVGKIWVNNHAHVLEEREDVAKLRYLFYVLQTIDVSDIVRGTPPKINQQNLRGIQLPLPPMPVQEEIVRILDAFANLIENINTEIKERERQLDCALNALFDCNIPTKTLGEIGGFYRGNGLQKKDFVERGIGCIHYGQIYTKFSTSAKETLTYVPEQLAKKLLKVHTGNLIIACTGENIEDLCKSVVWMGKEDIVIGGHSVVFRHTQDPLYIAYYFQSPLFAKQKVKYIIGAKVSDIKAENIAKINIPLPPLAEQRTIAEKLDTIEAFIANLKEERALRQQQYEYYREYLINLLK